MLNYGPTTRGLHHKFEWIERDRTIPAVCPPEWVEVREPRRYHKFAVGSQGKNGKGKKKQAEEENEEEEEVPKVDEDNA